MSAASIPLLRHGIDLCEVERIRRAVEGTPGFVDRVFTEGERAYCRSQADPAMHYAARFAAKEAALKALGIGLGGIGVTRSLQDVEVVRDGGPPRLRLAGKPGRVAAGLGIRATSLSLTHTKEHAVASVVMLGTAPEEGEDGR